MKQVEEGLKIAPDYADLLALRERLVSRFAKTAPKQCIP
jgi:hypothetical protein